jgi:predicted DsbA family dithiol-disulfide isomerase
VPGHVRRRMASPENPLTARAHKLGITLIEREWVPSSRRAHECSEFARAADRLDAFHALLLKAYWAEKKDLHDWSVLQAAAAIAGIDAAAMKSAVESGALRSAVDQRVAAAHELGVHAVPTFLVADRLVIQGAQTADAFRTAFQRLGIAPRG